MLPLLIYLLLLWLKLLFRQFFLFLLIVFLLSHLGALYPALFDYFEYYFDFGSYYCSRWLYDQVPGKYSNIQFGVDSMVSGIVQKKIGGKNACDTRKEYRSNG